MFNLCLFSSYVMPGEQRTRSWLTSLYNKDIVIDSFVETNDKIPGEAPTLISENIQSLFYCSMKLTYWKFWMGRVDTCCTMYIYMYGVDTKIWMAFFEILLYRTCTCKRKLTLRSVRLLILSLSPINRASLWWLWFYSCFASYASTSGEGLVVHSTCTYSCTCEVVMISVKLCHSHTSYSSCVCNIYMYFNNILYSGKCSPLIFSPLMPSLSSANLSLFIPIVSRRIQNGAELFASVEG